MSRRSTEDDDGAEDAVETHQRGVNRDRRDRVLEAVRELEDRVAVLGRGERRGGRPRARTTTRARVARLGAAFRDGPTAAVALRTALFFRRGRGRDGREAKGGDAEGGHVGGSRDECATASARDGRG